MIIERIDIYRMDIPLKQSIRVPIGVLSAAENIVVAVSTDTGVQGWGEGSPFAPITGDSQAACFAEAGLYAKCLLGKSPLAIECRMNELRRLSCGASSLLAAFDIALYDIAGQHAGLPIYQLLGGEARHLATDFTIGNQDSVENTVLRLRDGLDAGFDTVKVKVGRPGWTDLEHLRAVREEGGDALRIRIDANQGWSFQDALRFLRATESLNIEYAEQPLHARDLRGHARLREAVAVPICGDETVFDSIDASNAIRGDALDYINIKLGKSGGISEALRIEAVSRAAGVANMIGCFVESRLGLTASAHLAMARPNISFIDLDAHLVLSEDPVEGGVYFEKGQGMEMGLPEEPGLGARLAPDFLARCDHYAVTP